MGKLKDNYWPDITTAAMAEKCIKNAAGVAYFVAGITALFAILAWFKIFRLLSPWSLLDAALFSVTAFFISRGSRVAAIFGLVLYLIEAVDRIASGTGGSTGGFSVLMIIFTLFFINGIRGTFALVRLQKLDNNAPQPDTF